MPRAKRTDVEDGHLIAHIVNALKMDSLSDQCKVKQRQGELYVPVLGQQVCAASILLLNNISAQHDARHFAAFCVFSRLVLSFGTYVQSLLDATRERSSEKDRRLSIARRH